MKISAKCVLPVVFHASCLLLCTGLMLPGLSAQAVPDSPAPAAPPPTAPAQKANPLPPAIPLQPRPEQTPADAAEQLRISKLPKVNGVAYDQPSVHDTVIAYAKDTYGLQGIVATTVRALYSEARGKPEGWGTDFPGFTQRYGASAATTIINGNVRLGMSLLFHEDLRYLPCNGCSGKRKVENALLSEITARHNENGQRFFTLTPTIADFSGPLIIHSSFYPGAARSPYNGFISARTVFATRIGLHLIKEFYADPSKKAKKADKKVTRVSAITAAGNSAATPAVTPAPSAAPAPSQL